MTITSSTVAPLPLTTKGDIVVHNGTRPVRFPVGTNGQVMVADSTSSTGIKWDTAGSGSSTDHHSSWEEITSVETVTVSERKQMVVFGMFILEGVINVDGTLIVKD